MTTISPAETSVPLPDLGESVTSATVTRWLKQTGDEVALDEPILEVSTDKVDTEIVSPAAGTLLRILADEDSVVAVGEPLAVIGAANPAAPLAASVPAEEATPDRREQAAQVTAADTVEPDPEPAAAAAISTAGSTTATTVAAEPARSADSTTEKLPRIRQTIARRMMESLHTSAQLTTVVEADVTAVAAVRGRHKDDFLRQTGIKLSFLPFFVKAAVDALAEHRVINASLNPDATEASYHHACHLGMAVDSPKGLMVPVIQHAENLSVSGLARAIADLAGRVRDGTIGADELSGGTFTITNTGSRGALFDTPIINQPQSAILGIGSVVERVVPMRIDGSLQLSVRSMAYLSLSYDHRLVDGADAAGYLGAVKTRLATGFNASDM
ncbi:MULTISPECIES: 2-oxo acid dehydrogenase subunit E2 [unclassified Mycobacterium]|uniref:2-oxo acid dehydrogenase subunit E2 n=1 Tax=unclassified Mycobacterium TaxID=2642494 RepID=UPI0029C7DAA6|nr:MULTISPECIES: 2-oxo acid dehydrogenase subunit E2 [unclassified Mycobacterium]